MAKMNRPGPPPKNLYYNNENLHPPDFDAPFLPIRFCLLLFYKRVSGSRLAHQPIVPRVERPLPVSPQAYQTPKITSKDKATP